MHHRILQHRFTDSKANVITLAVVHFVFAVLLLFPGKIAVFSWGRPQLCLLIAGIFLGLYRYYDWKNHAVNLAISGCTCSAWYTNGRALGSLLRRWLFQQAEPHPRA